MIIDDAQVSLRSIDDHDDSFLDILEGLEGLQQVLGQLGQLIGSGLADVRLVDHDDYLDLGVNIE